MPELILEIGQCSTVFLFRHYVFLSRDGPSSSSDRFWNHVDWCEERFSLSHGYGMEVDGIICQTFVYSEPSENICIYQQSDE